MLRRTKQDMQTRQLTALPAKTVETIRIQLDNDERVIYDELMASSRTLLKKFLAQQAKKADVAGKEAGRKVPPSSQTSHRDTRLKIAQQYVVPKDHIGGYQILVRLLRLRQLCCHPSLIHCMLEAEDFQVNGLRRVKDPAQLAQRLSDVSLRGEEMFPHHVREVFQRTQSSSKMNAVLAKVDEIIKTGQKIVLVSQWTSALEIIADELENVTSKMFTGKVPVKCRQAILDDFNDRNSETNVLLLSLTAGGVGLNLVEANHLILMEPHWNPQLESQAGDRIYRFGQKQNVWIYKFICSGTIEERIEILHRKKIQIADSLLSGNGKAAAS